MQQEDELQNIPSRRDGRSEHIAGAGPERPLWPAVLRGWRGCCPNCGGGPMMAGYLKVRDHCPSCGEAFHHHRADDLPAWGTIMIVGHIVGFGFFHAETTWRPPLWVHWAIWPALGIGLAVWLLPRIKGAAVAMQWARRMHGFGGHAEGDHRPGTRR